MVKFTFFIALVLTLMTAGVPGTLDACCDDIADPTEAALAYFDAMSVILAYATETESSSIGNTQNMTMGGSALSVMTEAQDFYTQKIGEIEAITPPAALVNVHQTLLDAFQANEEAFGAILETLSEDVPASDVLAYMFAAPDPGYAFGMETDAQCLLQQVAYSYGIETFPSRVACYERPQAGETLGSPQAPVNDITLVHAPDCDGQCPRLQYEVTRIYASAAEPITLTFDNQNPFPFLFNLALYRGNDERLQAEDLITRTDAWGPRVHTLTVTLDPGIYTYVDNVHPYSVRGLLIVVGGG